jgi:lactoylglutathione lyase
VRWVIGRIPALGVRSRSGADARLSAPSPVAWAEAFGIDSAASRGERGTVEAWPSGIRAITLFVEDLQATKRFYAEVFGLGIAYEDDDSAVFDFGNAIINLLRTEAATELIHPAPVASAAHGSRAQYTIEVEDVDAVCAELVGRGVELLNGPMDRPWGIRTASFRDPAGHIWEIAR